MRYVVAIGLLMFVTSGVQAQSALLEMVKTEQAFSKMAEEKNTRDAFMTFIADDGLLFRPGAVNGKKWMLEHPVPPSDKKPLLAWQPAFAGMAASGDMGFTTGPWEAKADIKDEKPSGYGHFITVWKKQKDGNWRFVVDLGISHPQSGGPQTLWQPADASAKASFKRIDVAKARKLLLGHELKYTLDSIKFGNATAFPSHAAPDVRLYRDGNLPYVGREAATEALAKMTGRMSWQVNENNMDVSRAGDLGYTYGTYKLMDDADKVIGQGSFVRIWRQRDGVWQIVMDVINSH